MPVIAGVADTAVEAIEPLLPEALLQPPSVTMHDTVPELPAAPAVTLIELVLEVPLQPVPETVQA